MIICTVFICINIGAIGLIGILFVFIGTYLNGKVSVKMFSIRKETMVLSDLRAKTMTESISGIRLIKFYGWENMVFKNLEKIRVLESHFILLSSIIRAYIDVISRVVSPCSYLTVFGIYIA